MSKERDEGLMVLDSQNLGTMITTMMEPVLQAIGTMLRNNTQAIDRIAATQTVMSNRMEALERQIRLNTPIDAKQERYLNAAMKSRARELLDKRGYADDTKAVKSVANAIKRNVLSRYGIGTMRQVPRHEYPVCMNQINSWIDALVIRDTVKEARERAERQNLAAVSSESMADDQPRTCMDG